MARRLGSGTRQGAAYLRIMKDAADNPETTSRFDYDKFVFDSQSGDLAYPLGIYTPANPSPPNMGYPPTLHANAKMDDEAGNDWWDLGGYSFDQRLITGGTEIRVDSYFDTEITNGVINVRGRGSNFGFPQPTDWAVAAFQLPGNAAANPFPSGTGGGSRIFKDETRFRIPRPGIDMWNSNPRNFIVHENMAPARVIYATTHTIGIGTTPSFTMPVPTTQGTVRPVVVCNMAIEGEAATYPMHGRFVGGSQSDDRRYRVQYRWVNATTLQFREKIQRNRITIGFCVVAFPNDGQTSGGDGSSIRTGGAGSSRYLQIVRPQAANNHNWEDVLLDSRLQVLPLVDSGLVQGSDLSRTTQDGSLPVSGGRVFRAQRSIPNLGYTPLVLASWYATTSDPNTAGNGRYTYWQNSQEGVNTRTGMRLIRIHAASLDFFVGGADWNNAEDFDAVRCRYYVFAIPQGSSP